MKTITALLNTLLSITTFQVMGADNFSISARTNAITYESITVSWRTPTLNISFFDWVGYFTLQALDNNPIDWKYVTFRFGDTDFVIRNKGKYDFRLLNWNNNLEAKSNPILVTEPAEDPLPVRNFPSIGKNIIAFGDSLVSGTGASVGSNFVSVLAKKIGKQIINAGVSGDTTEKGLARLSRDVLSQNPKIVVLCLGGDDFLQRVPNATTFANLTTIIQKIHETGSIVIMLGVQTGFLTDNFNSLWRLIFENENCVYVPNILYDIAGHPTRLSDAVHPNNVGYHMIADRLAPILMRLDTLPEGRLLVQKTASASIIELTWLSVSGRQYEIFSSDKIDSSFRSASKITGDGKLKSITIDTSKSEQLFWFLK